MHHMQKFRLDHRLHVVQSARMEKIEAYLKDNGLSQRQFAELIGVDESLVSRYMAKTTKPKVERMFEIERITNGGVPVSAWNYRLGILPEDGQT